MKCIFSFVVYVVCNCMLSQPCPNKFDLIYVKYDTFTQIICYTLGYFKGDGLNHTCADLHSSLKTIVVLNAFKFTISPFQLCLILSLNAYIIVI